MFLDKELLLSDEQALTVTAYSTNTIDLAANRKIWKGRQLYLVVTVDEAADGADAAKTLRIEFVNSANANLSSHVALLATDTIVGAALTLARAPIVIPLGAGLDAALRYAGVRYVVSATFTAFKLSAFIALDVQSNV